MNTRTIPADVAGPADLSIVAAAREFIPRLRERAQAAERLQHVPDETIDELERLNLMRLMDPRKYGGRQASLRTVADVAQELAKGCGSTSWAVCIYNTVPCFLARYSERAQEEVFTSKNPRLCTSTGRPDNVVKRVDGGFLLKGRWPFASGQHHAGWVNAMGMVPDEDGGPPDPVLFAVPRASFVALDDWDTSGFCATGSNTLELQSEEFVPEYRAKAMSEIVGGEPPDDPYYATALGASPLVSGAVFLGMAKSALEILHERIHTRGITYTSYASQAEAPAVQMQVAEATMLLDEAEFHLDRALANAAKKIDMRDVISIVRSQADVSRTLELSRKVIDIVHQLSGARSIQRKDPVQRALRDIDTISVHARMFSLTNKELYGRVLCGQPPDPAMFAA